MLDALPHHLTTAQAAKVLAVTPDKITDLIHTGQLVAVDVSLRHGGKARWRISREALQAWIRSRTSNPPVVTNHRRKVGNYQRKYY